MKNWHLGNQSWNFVLIIKRIDKTFYHFIYMTNLFLNEYIFSCSNTNLLKLLLEIPLNTRFVSRLETLETTFKDIVASPLLSKIHLFSMKPNRFFVNKELPLLFSCNFLTPKCSSLMLLLSFRDAMTISDYQFVLN